MVKTELSLQLLYSMEMAVFERLSPYQYRSYGLVPQFYSDIFPAENDGSVCREPWQYSAMLEFFITAAEDFFDKQAPGTIHSGIWIEEWESGEELPLLAFAHIFDNRNVLVIQCVRDDYNERTRILRKARIELLERRKVTNDLSEFKKKSQHDSLTNLYNHGTFLEILEHDIEHQKSYSPGLALLIVDIDDFKKVNDTYGHLAGDSVLNQMGQLLSESLRKNDTPARFGGEEFTIIAGNTTLHQAHIIAEKLRQNVEEHDFGIGKTISVSIGATIYQYHETAEELIGRADKALYDAKRAGKNCVKLRIPWVAEAKPNSAE